VKRGLIAAVVLVSLTAMWIWRQVRGRGADPLPPTPVSDSSINTRQAPPPAISSTGPVVLLPVAVTAAQLNAPDRSTADDIATLGILLGEFRRNLGGNPVGDNDEITAALLGRNQKRIACLPSTGGSFLDGSGRLIDRWGSPYFFHALSVSDMEIRSAGPDREFQTTDDVTSER
jgi:hypothetical protein